MYITHPEKDFWPWTWTHNGVECDTVEEHIDAWKSIDPYTDKIFDSRGHQNMNDEGDPLEKRIADSIVCKTHKVDITDKISVSEYQQYALEKFYTQMESLCNEHGKVALGLSGGIDSTMMLSWLVKNNADFDTFVVRQDAWRGMINKICESNAIKMTEILGVNNHVINMTETDFDLHALIKDYCEAKEVEFPCLSYATQPPASMRHREKPFKGHIISPIGNDDFFLHRLSSWVRFIPDHMLENLKKFKHPVDFITDYGYKVPGFAPEWPVKKDPTTQQVIHRIDDDIFLAMHTGHMSSMASSREWYEMWHKIDEGSCTIEQLKDMMAVGWLKNHVSSLVGDDIMDLIKSVSCTEQYYHPNDDNRKYIIDQCNKFADIFKRQGNPTQQVYWRSAIAVIETWGKVSEELIHGINTLNWLENNRK